MYKQILYIAPPFLSFNSRILFTLVPASGSLMSDSSFGAGTLTWWAPSSTQLLRLLYVFRARIKPQATPTSRFWCSYWAFHVVSSKSLSLAWGKEEITSAPLCLFSLKKSSHFLWTYNLLILLYQWPGWKILSEGPKNHMIGLILLL